MAPLYELIAICGLQCYILYLCSPQDTDRHLYTCRSESPNFAKKISLSLDGSVVYFKDEITDLQVGFVCRPSRVNANKEDAAVGFICFEL